MNVWLVRIASVLALVLLGAWLVSATEWADAEVPTPAKGEARTNSLYATQALLRELGAKVVKRDSLDAMPPAGARLVLASNHWDLFPERGQRLRAWVEQGGHLVMPSYLVGEDMLEDWVPLVEEEDKPVVKKDTPIPTPPSKKKSRDQAEKDAKDEDCHSVVEPDTVPASFAGGRRFRLCAAWSGTQYLPSDEKPALWAAEGPSGTEAVRVGVGRGTVTVMPWGLLHNTSLLRADNALFATAAFQARAGSEVWFVMEEAREPFLKWIWRHGWAAMVVGLLALAVALWRAAVRFGPLALSAGTHRRSMAEQVRGTAGFLHMHGSGALHEAQLRALNESAGRHLRRYRDLAPPARAAAIAQATGLAAAMLTRAMSARARAPEAMAVDLEVLETARRRLEANGPRQPSSVLPSSPSTTTSF
ncbi:DUF4350 domain-containing protein [Variovorax boronicumulans]|uniref:DUF4350 domain-containing protein n=1 Tax=Variovorax boronicumulans TaxID=436515 RepID=UPI00339215D3